MGKKEDFAPMNPARTANVVFGIFLLITSIAIFVPLSPRMPSDTLDFSWAFGLNQALVQGLVFGREMTFTCGPYVSVFSRLYHPATDLMMIGGGLYLALSYWACFLLFMRGVLWRWALAYFSILAGLRYFPGFSDALFFSFPLLAGLTAFKIIASEDGILTKGRYAPFYVALIFAPFGLLPLIKGSMLILCGAITLLCIIFFIVNEKRVLAAICLASPAVSMLVFWIAAGQPVTNLPDYFIGMAPIISGYSEAMAYSGNSQEVISYLAAAFFLLLAIALQKQISTISKIFLLCIFFVFLFLSFKGGFVRHDIIHVVLATTSIMLAALLLPFIFSSRIMLLVIVFSLMSGFYINSFYIRLPISRIAVNVMANYLFLVQGLTNRIIDRSWPRRNYDAALATLRENASFPILPGTTDIYSYRQLYLISSGNTWSPRPILQSYSAYTPLLAELNKRHLQGSQAPDNVIFRVEPIDGRIPAIEDGVSWPLLISSYFPTQIENGCLFLQKKEVIGEITESLKFASETHAFGENVYLPQSSQLIFVQIEIDQTFLGGIANVFFKPSQLQIAFELQDGINRRYRIIAGMAKSGFLISPLIENTAEFGMLYGKKEYLDGKRVKSFVIMPTDGKTRLWREKFTVTFSQLANIPPIDLSKVFNFDRFQEKLLSCIAKYMGSCASVLNKFTLRLLLITAFRL